MDVINSPKGHRGGGRERVGLDWIGLIERGEHDERLGYAAVGGMNEVWYRKVGTSCGALLVKACRTKRTSKS